MIFFISFNFNPISITHYNCNWEAQTYFHNLSPSVLYLILKKLILQLLIQKFYHLISNSNYLFKYHLFHSKFHSLLFANNQKLLKNLTLYFFNYEIFKLFFLNNLLVLLYPKLWWLSFLKSYTFLLIICYRFLKFLLEPKHVVIS